MTTLTRLSRRHLGAYAAGAALASPCGADDGRDGHSDVAVAWLADGDPATGPGRAARLIDDIATCGPRPAMIVLMARAGAHANLRAASDTLTAQALGWGVALQIVEAPAAAPIRGHDLVTLQQIPNNVLG